MTTSDEDFHRFMWQCMAKRTDLWWHDQVIAQHTGVRRQSARALMRRMPRVEERKVSDGYEYRMTP